jgi:hypothetical protein
MERVFKHAYFAGVIYYDFEFAASLKRRLRCQSQSAAFPGERSLY